MSMTMAPSNEPSALQTQLGPHPIALAFAVAALQTANDSSSLEASKESFCENVHRRAADAVVVTDAFSITESAPANTTASRLARSRDRNREHARRTRLRKKAQLAALQKRVTTLKAEKASLQQSVQDCSIARILLGLQGCTADQTMLETEESLCPETVFSMGSTSANKRNKRKEHGTAAPPQPLTLLIDGETTVVGGGKSHINWKTGICNDASGRQKHLTVKQLETLRRERNRMHAKMTRDRKKNFIANMEKTVEDLESEVQRMRAVLSTTATTSTSRLNQVTPMTSPELTATEGPHIAGDTDDDSSSVYSQVVGQENEDDVRSTKKPRHGFSLND